MRHVEHVLWGRIGPYVSMPITEEGLEDYNTERPMTTSARCCRLRSRLSVPIPQTIGIAKRATAMGLNCELDARDRGFRAGLCL